MKRNYLKKLTIATLAIVMTAGAASFNMLSANNRSEKIYTTRLDGRFEEESREDKVFSIPTLEITKPIENQDLYSLVESISASYILTAEGELIEYNGGFPFEVFLSTYSGYQLDKFSSLKNLYSEYEVESNMVTSHFVTVQFGFNPPALNPVQSVTYSRVINGQLFTGTLFITYRLVNSAGLTTNALFSGNLFSTGIFSLEDTE